jgi:hypothetical protein
MTTNLKKQIRLKFSQQSTRALVEGIIYNTCLIQKLTMIMKLKILRIQAGLFKILIKKTMSSQTHNINLIHLNL